MKRLYMLLLLSLALALANIPTAQAENPAIVPASDVVATNPNWNEINIDGDDYLNYTPNTLGGQKLTITAGTLGGHFAAGANDNNSSKEALINEDFCFLTRQASFG